MKLYASEIRVGMLIEYKNDLWQVLKTQQSSMKKHENNHIWLTVADISLPIGKELLSSA